jgi:membrane-bound serine protease (ClpP class)
MADPENTKDKNLIYLIKVEGEIDLGLAPFIKRVIEDTDKEEIETLILEINTFGGRLDAAVQIRDALLNADTLTIAFINERAISAGALISLACKKIVMAPGATIGAATPVTIGPLTSRQNPPAKRSFPISGRK